MYVQNLIKDKHKAKKNWQRTRIEVVRRKLNQLTRRVKWELDNLRFNSYRVYLGKQRSPIPPLKNGIAKYDTNAEKSEAFADYFESCSTTETNTASQNEILEKATNRTEQNTNKSVIKAMKVLGTEESRRNKPMTSTTGSSEIKNQQQNNNNTEG
ncbi:hypothetical protein QTP88_008172 [Uroleucon formosanum]